jgi:formamidopyrimidine-DNA glycosylase
MPEGHTLHRYARLHRKALAGRPVRVDSPQGHFTGSSELDGRRLETVDAHGKHLFYRFAGGRLLHVHLGLFGQFRRFPAGRAPEPTPATRLRLAGDGAVLHLSGPIACELTDEAGADALVARLGPDPLDRGADGERAWAALQRRRTPVAQALLDQSVIAGVGNVFRAEVLFRAGIPPDRPARGLTRAGFEQVWADLARLMRAAERSGRIVTVEPAHLGARTRAEVPDDVRCYVYRRAGEPCRRCGELVVAWPLGGRSVYACPSCQGGVQAGASGPEPSSS